MKKYNCPDCSIVADSCDGCPRIPKNLEKELEKIERSSQATETCPVNGYHEWEYDGMDTGGTIFICKHCGQYRHIPYTPYPDYTRSSTSTDAIPPACRSCPNHPSNGGSGICHCILGQLPVYY